MSTAAAELRLVVTDGNARGSQIIVGEALVIGRRAEDPGSLGGDPEISGRHAEIRRSSDGGFVIEDLNSRYGTMVNGEVIATPRPLRLNDHIEVGASSLVVQAITAPPSAAPPAEPAPNLSLKLDIDALTGIGRLDLGDGAEPIALVHRDGRWEVER